MRRSAMSSSSTQMEIVSVAWMTSTYRQPIAPVERVEDLVPGQADPLEAAGLRDPDGLEVFIVTSGHGLSLD